METSQATSPSLVKETARQKFERLARQWKEEARFWSDTRRTARLKPYQHIIGMGPEALPLILEAMRREPDHWFMALESITEQDPVPPEARGYVDRMAKAWIEWGIRNGVIPA